MMRTGTRSVRIVYQRDTGTSDGTLGTHAAVWTEQAQDFARIGDGGGTESRRGDQTRSNHDYMVLTRFRRDIKPDETWRLYVPEYDLTLNITSIQNVDFRNNQWLIRASKAER